MTERNEAGGGKKKAGIKRKMCYSCGEYVPADAEKCPECGAGPPKFNPAWVLRVAVGFLIGFFLWLIFMV